MVKIVCISDTHTLHEKIHLPYGDILIHAGDFTSRGKEAQVRAFGKWFRDQPHAHKIVIAGNHDLSFETKNKEAINWLYNDAIDDSFHYLQDASVTVDVDGRNIKIYGSPWQPEFCAWAFNVERGPKLAAIWDLLPEDTDVLITHGPPAGILDLCVHGERVGCVDLLHRVKELKQLKLHVFGHIHESHGVESLEGDPIFVNASSCDFRYAPDNKPIIVEI